MALADAIVGTEPCDPETGEVLGAPPARPDEGAPPVSSMPFGRWLLQQTKHDGWIGDLAKGLKSHPRFPKQGTPDDVRKLLSEMSASGDDFEAVDDAELEWLSY